MQITNNPNNITEVEHTTSFLKKWFDEFNEKYFDNKLDNNIKLKWVSDSKERLGGFNYEPQTDKNDEYVKPISIELKTNIKTFETFRNVLVHEMVHYYANCYLNNYTDEQWENARELGKEDAYKALGLEPPDNHLGNWLHFINSLNSKFKELNITAFGSNNKVCNNVNDLHIIAIVYLKGLSRNVTHKVYSSESLEELKKKIEECKTIDKNKPIVKFFDLKILDYKKLATSGVKENEKNECLTKELFDYLVKAHIVRNVNENYLGAVNGI